MGHIECCKMRKLKPFENLLNPIVKLGKPPPRLRKVQASISYNIGLGGQSSTQSKSAYLAVKRRFGFNFFRLSLFACGALQGASPRGPCRTAQNRPPWSSPSSPSAPKGESEPREGATGMD